MAAIVPTFERERLYIAKSVVPCQIHCSGAATGVASCLAIVLPADWRRSSPCRASFEPEVGRGITQPTLLWRLRRLVAVLTFIGTGHLAVIEAGHLVVRIAVTMYLVIALLNPDIAHERVGIVRSVDDLIERQ